MAASLKGGIADSVGCAPDMVVVTHMNGRTLDSWYNNQTDSPSNRHLQTVDPYRTQVSFAIQSASVDPIQVQTLEYNIRVAADEGAVVANIQKKALEYGVLTAALKYMDRKLPRLRWLWRVGLQSNSN
jgi:hypothetical protein